MNPIREDSPASYYRDFNGPRCSCQGPEEALCPCRVADALRPALERQRIALEERNECRRWCRERLSEIEEGKRRRWHREQASRNEHEGGDRFVGSIDRPPDLGRLKFEADALRRRLAALKHACNTAAIQRDQLAVANDAREAEYQLVRSRLDGAARRLHSLYVGDDGGGGGLGILPSLELAEREANDSNRRRRMQLALLAFEMHRVDCGPENRDAFSAMMGGEGEDGDDDGGAEGGGGRRRRQRSSPGGIGKIGGLPLPHAGPALYGALPPGGLTSALRLIGSLASALAMVLGVAPLPHPILLRPPPGPAAAEDGDDWEEVGGGGGGGEDGPCDVADLAMFRRQREDDAGTGKASSTAPRQGAACDASLGACAVVPRVAGPRATASLPAATWTSTSTPTPTLTATSSWSIRGAAAATLSLAGRAILSTAGAGTAAASPVEASRSPSSSSGPWGGGHRQVTSEEAANSESARRRVRHATALVIRERPVPSPRRSSGGDGTGSTAVAEFELNLPRDGAAAADDGDDDEMRRRRVEEFQVGLQLLQNDVVALCVRAGVPVGTLWPAEAILLNLCSLRVFCRRQLQLMGDELGRGGETSEGR